MDIPNQLGPQGPSSKEMRMKRNNLVAKHARSFNKSAVHTDRKRASKRGYRKHKGKLKL